MIGKLLFKIRFHLYFFPKLNQNISKDIFFHPTHIKFKQKFSEIYLEQNILIKIIKVQKYADYIRRYFNSQARREYMGVVKLQNIGINIPNIYGYGFNVNPFQKADSILLMEYIAGESLLIFFQTSTDTIYRKEILKSAAEDLVKMHLNGLHHKDTNLGNIILFKEKLYWIDNDVMELSFSIDDRKYIFNALKRIVGKREYLSNEEIRYFIDSYIVDIKIYTQNNSDDTLLQCIKSLNFNELLK